MNLLFSVTVIKYIKYIFKRIRLTPDIKTVFGTFLERNSADIQDGTAFLGEPNPVFQLTAYLNLIKVLQVFSLEGSFAEAGFQQMYQQIESRSLSDPASKAHADLLLVKLLLSQQKPDQALSRAKSIMALTTPQVENEWLREASIRQVQECKMEAYSEVALYLIQVGQTQDAYELALEAKHEGDLLRFVWVYRKLCEHYSGQNKTEKKAAIVVELQAYLEELKQKIEQDDFIDPVLGFIVDKVEEVIGEINGKEKVGTDRSSYGFAGMRVDRSFNSDLANKLTTEAHSLDQLQASEEYESKIATIVVSTCAYIGSKQGWIELKPVLISLLERVTESYYMRVSMAVDEDGQFTGEKVLERQGNSSIVEISTYKKVPSLHFYYVVKMELAYTAAKFEDFVALETILDTHFSLNEMVSLFSRATFQALQGK